MFGKLLCVTVIAVTVAGCTPHVVVEGTPRAGDPKLDLWPVENGYYCAVSPVKWPLDVKWERLVFDVTLLEPAYKLWKAKLELAASMPASRSAELEDKPLEAEDGLVTPMEAFSQCVRAAAKAAKPHKVRLIEAMVSRGNIFVRFYAVEKKGSSIIRKPVREEDRKQLEKYFWPQWWKIVGVEKDPFLQARVWHNFWDCLEWDRFEWPFRQRENNEYRLASGRFVVEYAGTSYRAAIVDEEKHVLVVPGMGMVAMGFLRSDAPVAKRRLYMCAVRIIVPSLGLDIHNWGVKVRLVRETK